MSIYLYLFLSLLRYFSSSFSMVLSDSPDSVNEILRMLLVVTSLNTMGFLVNWKERIFHPRGPYMAFLRLTHTEERSMIYLGVRNLHTLERRITLGILIKGWDLFCWAAIKGLFDFSWASCSSLMSSYRLSWSYSRLIIVEVPIMAIYIVIEQLTLIRQ